MSAGDIQGPPRAEAVCALFKLSAVLTVLWVRLFPGEGGSHQRLLGAVVMGAGFALVAV